MIFIVEAFFSGCISKVINDGKDYSWIKIKNVINDRHNHNISTKIYRVIEKSLNIVTDNTYKGSDKLYDAIEEIFVEFKNHRDTLESVKYGLGVLGTDVSEQRCENFLERFYEGIRQDDDLYKTVILDLQQEDIKISQEEFQKLNEKIDNLTKVVSRENDNKINIRKREPVKSTIQEYIGGKIEINVHNTGQINFVKDNDSISVAQSSVNQNTLEDSIGKNAMGIKFNNKISLFISYSWNDTNFVDKLDGELQKYGYHIVRDIRDAEYAQNIKEFMKEIRRTDYSIIVLSDNFLKSENCMREILEFIKDDNYRNRIIPVILDSAKDIWGFDKGIQYTIYWKDREDKFKEQLSKIDEESKGGYIEDLKHISSVKDSIGEIIKIFRDMKMVDANEKNLVNDIVSYLKKKNYISKKEYCCFS